MTEHGLFFDLASIWRAPILLDIYNLEPDSTSFYKMKDKYVQQLLSVSAKANTFLCGNFEEIERETILTRILHVIALVTVHSNECI